MIHGRIDQGDYTVEKVFFESFPGHFVTGNLYCPTGASLAAGRPRGGRSVLQARCVGLARMGCVAFHYDMIGYADSIQ